jgi:hypothetical protein
LNFFKTKDCWWNFKIFEVLGGYQISKFHAMFCHLKFIHNMLSNFKVSCSALSLKDSAQSFQGDFIQRNNAHRLRGCFHGG